VLTAESSCDSSLIKSVDGGCLCEKYDEVNLEKSTDEPDIGDVGRRKQEGIAVFIRRHITNWFDRNRETYSLAAPNRFCRNLSKSIDCPI
jgi:hypothetical protein